MAPRSSSYSPGSSIAPAMETVTRSIGTTTRSFIHRGADAAWTGSRAGRELRADRRGDLSFRHRAGEDSDVRVAYSPERAIPGNMLHELTNNDRVVGGVSGACAAAAAGLYRVFVRGRSHVTGARTAELVKLTENAYRDVNIAFANEISLVCDSLGIDPWELIGLANGTRASTSCSPVRASAATASRSIRGSSSTRRRSGRRSSGQPGR